MASSSSSASSSSLRGAIKDGEPINWAELPPEIISSILLRLCSIEILENAQKVCRSWRRVCKDPSMWRKIDMDNNGDSYTRSNYMETKGYKLEAMCRHAVDRSQGGLLDIDIWYFGSDGLLNYIADRSSNLRRLCIKFSSRIADEAFVEAIVKLPLLEYLEVSYGSLLAKSVKVAGKSCPNLKKFKLNRNPGFHEYDRNDEEALAIAESMPQLSHLQLYGNFITNTGLNAILDGCPHLEHLDLRRCDNIRLYGDLAKRCSQKIKYLKRPTDSTDDYPFGAVLYDVSGDYHDDD